MAKNKTAPKPAAEVAVAKAETPCKCLLGWTGTAGKGSTLKAAKDYTHPCDRMTKGSFAQGHDARMSSRLATEIATGETPADVATKLIELAGGSDLLVGKTLRSAELRAKKLTAKADKATAKASKPEAKADTAGDDEAEAISRVRATAAKREVAPVANPEPDTEPDGDSLPVEGATVNVTHGKREYTATIVDSGDGLLVAQHGMFGKMCSHDLDTGEVVSSVASEEAPEF